MDTTRNFASTYRHPTNINEVAQVFRDKLTPDEMKEYLKLTVEKLEDYHKTFLIFDDDNNGRISKYEIQKVMTALGEKISTTKLDEMVKQIDYDDDAELDFDEFTCLMVKRNAENQNIEEELVLVFNRFDKDGDGEIGVQDLMETMLELGHSIDLEEAHDMVFQMDKDEDGSINFLEFVQTMLYDTLDTELLATEKRFGLGDK